MRKLLIIIFMGLSFLRAAAQAKDITKVLSSAGSIVETIVNDPKANASLVETIQNGREQIKKADKYIDLLEDSKDLLEQVNTAFLTMNYVTDISIISKKIIDESIENLKGIQKTNAFSSNEMKTITGNFSNLLLKGNAVFKVAEDLLKNGIFKMDDGDRLTLLKAQKLELEQILMSTRIGYDHYIHMAKQRMMKHLFKKQG